MEGTWASKRDEGRREGEPVCFFYSSRLLSLPTPPDEVLCTSRANLIVILDPFVGTRPPCRHCVNFRYTREAPPTASPHLTPLHPPPPCAVIRQEGGVMMWGEVQSTQLRHRLMARGLPTTGHAIRRRQLPWLRPRWHEMDGVSFCLFAARGGTRLTTFFGLWSRVEYAIEQTWPGPAVASSWCFIVIA